MCLTSVNSLSLVQPNFRPGCMETLNIPLGHVVMVASQPQGFHSNKHTTHTEFLKEVPRATNI